MARKKGLSERRAERLAPHVRMRALRLGKRCGWKFELEDLEQMIWLGILEKGACWNKPDKWVVIGGEYSAATKIWKRHYREKLSRARTESLTGEDQRKRLAHAGLAGIESLTDQEWANLEASADGGPMMGWQSHDAEEGSSPLGWMEELFDTLPAIYRFVAEGLLAGFRRKEIAFKMSQAGFESRSPYWVGQFAKKKLAPAVMAWMAT
jgi:hypothetical protein